MADVLIIGGGAAGLAAAEVISSRGHSVIIAEKMPSIGRKILMAGKSGLNLSKDEPIERFLAQYSGLTPAMEAAIRAFGPQEMRIWLEGLGQESFIGSSGRLYPKAMKASPLLRAWIARLVSQGVRIEMRHEWRGGFAPARFDTPDGQRELAAKAVLLALGGASWPRLGSDGAWASLLDAPIVPFRAANMGFEIAWSDKMRAHFGAPVKNIALRVGDDLYKGELTITHYGVEGGAIYQASEAMAAGQLARLDLLPKMSEAELAARLARSGKRSLSTVLARLNLSPQARALFFEFGDRADAMSLKSLALPVSRARPLEEAISSAGGVRMDALDDSFALRSAPEVTIVGEMLDWSAPTGGYLLTACIAMGRYAGEQIAEKLALGV